MMRHLYLCSIICLLSLTSCDLVPDNLIRHDKNNVGMEFIDMQFSHDYDTIYAFVDIQSDLKGVSLSDTSKIDIRVSETVDFVPMRQRLVPQIYDVQNSLSAEAAKKELTVNLLVDLTLPQALVDKEKEAVKSIYYTFDPNNISLSIMADDSISAPMPLTPYALDNYFVSRPKSNKRLYRGIVESRDELRRNINSNNLALIVMSDGSTYDNDMPRDPDQYKYQEELTINRPELATDSMSIYYINFDNSESGVENDAYPILMNMAENYRGLYQENFDISALEQHIKEEFKLNYADYELMLLNPRNKIYTGTNNRLIINIADKDGRTLASDYWSYSLGNAYRPIVVGKKPLWVVIVQGVFLGGLLLLLAYIVLQLLLPYIQYRLFKKQYVLRYTGSNMAYANRMIVDSCYLCKDQFQPGDEIVAKCQHTMHKDCWDELGYHCPEHGRHCLEGSHYYNEHNVLDSKNAPAYASWVYVAILAAIAAWTFFTLEVNIGSIAHFIQAIENRYIQVTGDNVTDVPFLGFCIGGVFTLAFSIMSLRPRIWWRVAYLAIIRSICAALLCYLIFFLDVLIVSSFDALEYFYLFNWIPWALFANVITDCSTFHSSMRPSRLRIIIAAVIGIVAMYIFEFFAFGQLVDYRVLTLISFIIFAVGLGVCISSNHRRSERYYLSMKGDTKPIDIALYKWFTHDSDTMVTIGKAIDCDICMNWDIMSQIPPTQAQIYEDNDKLYLYTVEPGLIYMGKYQPEGKKIRLRHGTEFSIGNTTFTYVEMDREAPARHKLHPFRHHKNK